MAAALSAPVWLKMEAYQPTGSFKLRGVGVLCRRAVERGAKSLISSSGGNAGLAVAYAGARLGVPVTIFVPRSTSELTIARLRDEGALVEVHGAAWDDAHARALELAQASGAEYVHPFDHPDLWDGHATMIDEVKKDGPKPGAVVVAVGGGGLLVGVLVGLERNGWGDVPVLAVETEGAASYAAALKAGAPVELPAITSVARSLGARRVCDEAVAWSKRRPIVSWLVSDRAAVAACRRFADDHRALVEPACGAALAAVYDRAAPLIGRSPVLVIVCGGAAVTQELLDEWFQKL